ncbi:MAG: aminoglycoside/hydroxyurea antibiotic resistance kinase, partial [Acidimicrobiales bacterium]
MVHNKALAADARWWLDGLPELIAGLQRDWSIRVGRPFEDATEAFVIEAATDDGTPAVLKVVVPRDGEAAGHEITALRLCEGEGCVALLRDDVG